jgi:hypothetical protein
MDRFLFGLLILLTCASPCLAHGMIARGYSGPNLRFTSSNDEPTAVDAQIAALRQCRNLDLSSCEIVAAFENSCSAVAKTVAGSYSSADGETADRARANALAACSGYNHQSCSVALSICDGLPASAPAEPPATEHDRFGYGLVAGAIAQISRIAATAYSLIVAAGVVVAALLLWTFASIVSTTPIAILKRKIAILLWIGGPAASTFIPWVFSFFDQAHLFFYAALTSLWTSVYAALSIGVKWRRWNVSGFPPLDVLSLPFATFSFGTIAFCGLYVYAQYGLIPRPTGCEAPYPAFSVCGYFDYEPMYVVGATLLLLIICGAALPANSNLILGYDRLTAFARKGRSGSGPHPPPIIHSDHSDQAAPGRQTARPANEASTDVPSPWDKPPISDHTEEPQLDKKAVKEAFQRKRQQFDL